ncbi:MAG: hypothetical protein QOJ64_16 [Acidobacteriota bacterium]|jgi:formylglycine-generating enzyme required for sulfatase activity/predicted Ser/Thr protein kinase|nr:hypothetical protein [Acidobacteriota bacterium]
MPSPEAILQGRYRIIGQLGRGGLGTVYEALDLRVNALVALKQANSGGDAQSRRDFKSEAELLANLHHQALPKVMDYFIEGDDEFLVMEYIPGYDLLELLARRGSPFHVDSVARWADDLLDLLEYLHQRKPAILHRDIKPANLKLTQDEKIFLLDFGLAKGAAGQMATLLTNRSVRGFTPVYSPLEQILGRGTDHRSDLYSLGATMYHLLSGVPPTDVATRYELLESGQLDPLLPLRELNPRVPYAIADLITRAMAVPRKDRPENAGEMRRSLSSAHAEAKRSARIKSEGAADVDEERHETTQEGRVGATDPGERMGIALTVPGLEAAEPPPTGGRGKGRILLMGAGVLAVIGIVIAVTLWTRSGSRSAATSREIPAGSPSPSVAGGPAVANTSPSPSPGAVSVSTITENFNGASMELVLVPAGTFMMGSPDDQGYVTERPQHQVSVPAFYVSRYEVTQKQYQALMGINTSEFQGEDLPVENVSWKFAEDFCDRLSQVTGRKHRLPTEAEWEYACRAGTTTAYAFGNSLSASQANFDAGSTGGTAQPGVYRQRTTPVGSFKPNGFGLYDMHGNVWEWCLDIYHDSYNGAPVNGAAWTDGSGFRVVRGGSWISRADALRSTVRERGEEEFESASIGFRVVTVVQ